MSEQTEEVYAGDMPENTPEEILDKIAAIAWEIRCDWSDPRQQCRSIVYLSKKLKAILRDNRGA